MESKKLMLTVMILSAAAANVFVSAADPDPLRDFEGSGALSNFVLRNVFKNGDTSASALLKIPDRSSATALNVGLDIIRKLKGNMLPYTPRLELAPPAVCVPGRDITTMI
ncbi:hypothetical protein SELMODRAFT_402945 [Selaginella moellendorffii]|uniref:Uncharacterized protein n=1 Tax=Selaginella moellendorffii TaxID=88036 RepID=D8QNJ4_SELML|nr:hypothetical protein SELMODRAFT_402945 [Selaginella moellendorffii]